MQLDKIISEIVKNGDKTTLKNLITLLSIVKGDKDTISNISSFLEFCKEYKDSKEQKLSQSTQKPVRESVLPQTRTQTKPVQKVPQIDKNDPMNYAATLFEECDNKFGKNVPVYSGGSSFVPSVGGSGSSSTNNFSQEDADMLDRYGSLL
jgi:hypothetical protein